jgi:hypothetical protein
VTVCFVPVGIFVLLTLKSEAERRVRRALADLEGDLAGPG